MMVPYHLTKGGLHVTFRWAEAIMILLRYTTYYNTSMTML